MHLQTVHKDSRESGTHQNIYTHWRNWLGTSTKTSQHNKPAMQHSYVVLNHANFRQNRIAHFLRHSFSCPWGVLSSLLGNLGQETNLKCDKLRLEWAKGLDQAERPNILRCPKVTNVHDWSPPPGPTCTVVIL